MGVYMNLQYDPIYEPIQYASDKDQRRPTHKSCIMQKIERFCNLY